MTVLVGVDAGASHTEAVVGRDVTHVIARWRGGPGAIRPGNEAPAAAVLADAVRGVLEEAGMPDSPSHVVIGAAGAGREDSRRLVEELLTTSLKSAARVRVTTDGEIALAAAFPNGAGIVLAAGSGSIAYARDASGRMFKAGGLGWRIGDEGSGYALARGALNAVGRAADGRGETTLLSDRIMAAIGVASLEQLVRWSLSSTPQDVIALARVVTETAEAGDATATVLVDQAATDLARHVEALVPKLGEPRPVRVALNGGLLAPDSPVRRSLLSILRQSHSVKVMEDPVDPPVGALRLAAASRGG